VTDRIDRTLGRAAAFLVETAQRRARAVVLVSLALAGAALWLVDARLVVDTDPDRMTSPELPFRRTKAALEAAFPTARDNLLVVVEADDGADARRAAEALAAALRENADRFPDVLLPGAGALYERSGLLYAPYAELEAWVEAVSAEWAAAGRAGRPPDLPPPPATAPDPLQRLVVQPARDYTTLEPALGAIRAVREAAAALAPSPGLRVRVTGDLAVLSEEMSQIRTQVVLASLASFLLVTALLLYTLRSFRLFLATVLLLAVGLAWTAGFAALVAPRLNVLTTAFAVLYIGLGVDFGIHYAMGYRERRALGDPPERALAESGRQVGASLFFCALTTATGFYAFVPTDYAAVAELGLISGTGIFLSLVATLTFYPALVTLGLGDSPKLGEPARGQVSLPAFPLRHPGKVIAVALAVAVAAGAAATRVRFDENPLNVRDPRVESVQAMEDLLAREEISPWTAEVLAADRAAAREAARRLEALSEVERAVTVEDFLPARQDAKRALLARLPQPVAAALPARPVTVEELPEPLRRRYLAPDGRARVEVVPEEDLTAPGALDRFVDAVYTVRPDAAVAAVGTVEFARAIVDALRQALSTALAAIALLLLFLWRSLRDALVTLAPLALGTVVTSAFTVAIDLPFHFANVIVLPLLLGIGVDSGIHLMHRHRLHLRSDRDVLHTATARAVLFSALTTLVSFSTLTFASHGGMSSLALLLTVGIAAMLAANLLFLPALLAHLEPHPARTPDEGD